MELVQRLANPTCEHVCQHQVHECCILVLFLCVCSCGSGCGEYLPIGAMTSPGSAMHDLMSHYCTTGLVLNKEGRAEVAKICEVSKAFFRNQVETLIAETNGQPMLYSYSSDGTPLHTKDRVVKQLPTGQKVTRSGGAGHEYLVQQGFVRTLGFDGHKTLAILREPLPLQHGKSAGALFAAGVAFLPTLRELGHNNIAISHYCFDRGAFSAVSRLFHQHHVALAHVASGTPSSSSPGSDIGTERGLLPLLEWNVATACCNHDCHNGLKWGLHNHFGDAQLIQDVHIGTESLRNSYMQLLQNLGPWLVGVVEFVEDPSPSGTLEQLWTALGLPPDIVDVLANKLHLIFKDGRLEIHSVLAGDPTLFEEVSGVLLSVWKFTKFSASRWCTVGHSCRTLLAGYLTGVHSLVASVLAKPSESKYWLHGFDKLTTPALQFVAMAALCSYPSEGMLSELLEDDRVAKRADMLSDTLLEELTWLSNLPEHVWGNIGSTCGLHAQELRSNTLEAAHVSVAFIRHRTLSMVNEYPWSLLQGDINANLDRLKAAERPQESVASKIWGLLQIGFNRHELLLGLDLLSDCGWSTTSVEQQHGSAAVMHKVHPDYSSETLTTRSMVHMMRQFFRRSPEDHKEAALAAKVRRLFAKKPQHFTGRQMYFKDISDQLKCEVASGKREQGSAQKHIMQQHGARFATLDDTIKGQYATKAAIASAKIASDVADELSRAESELALHRERTTTKKALDRPRFLLSDCRFSANDVNNFEQLFASPMFTRKYVADLRESEGLAPPAPSPGRLAILEAQVLPADEKPSFKPFWLPLVCKNREQLANTAFAIKNDMDGEQLLFFKFVFAIQRPHLAVFAPMHEVWNFTPTNSSAAVSLEDLVVSSWVFHFEVDYSTDIHHSDEVWQQHNCRIFVLQGLLSLGCGSVVTDGDMVPLEDFLQNFSSEMPPQPKAKPKPKPIASSTVSADLLAKYPWLLTVLEQQGKKEPQSKDDGVSNNEGEGNIAGNTTEQEDEGHKDDSDEGEGGQQPSDSDLNAVFEDVRRMREGWAGDVVQPVDFRHTILGGAWAKPGTRTAYEFFRGSAATDPAKLWCVKYKTPQSATFYISVYGDTGCSILVQAWAHKMQHFFDIAQVSGTDDYKYTRSDISQYVEPTGFTEYVSSLPKGRAKTRAMQLKNWFPRV